MFFALMAVVCVLLVPATPPEFRFVPWAGAALATFWAVLLGLEELTRPRLERRDEPPAEIEMPFAPPPPPGR